ncbi:hypothetical protein IWX92DRAFT_357808, partial [Phyllosticta citricarpa]
MAQPEERLGRTVVGICCFCGAVGSAWRKTIAPWQSQKGNPPEPSYLPAHQWQNQHTSCSCAPDSKMTKEKPGKKRTTAGIRCWSPTQLLIGRNVAYLWKSGRGSEFSTCYGRT